MRVSWYLFTLFHVGSKVAEYAKKQLEEIYFILITPESILPHTYTYTHAHAQKRTDPNRHTHTHPHTHSTSPRIG